MKVVIQSLKVTGISHKREGSKDHLKYEDIDCVKRRFHQQ